MDIVKTLLIIVLILVLIGIVYNASRLCHKLYTVTYKSTKNPIWRAVKAGFRSLAFALVNLMVSEPYEG
jgi:HJR/Mrr/RecB family endonuclease